jgi:hypothetical protein
MEERVETIVEHMRFRKDRNRPRFMLPRQRPDGHVIRGTSSGIGVALVH